MKLTPILFEDNATDYVTQGIGALGDVLSGEVTEETNGQYEVRLTYPVTGRRYADLKNRRLIYCKPDPYRDAQPFRIYRITRPLNGIITIYARHKLYDLDGTPVNPFSASNALSAMKGLKANAAIETPYQFWTDINSNAQFSVSVPTSTRALLGGIKGSILDTYGGEYEWDNDTVKLYARRGSDNGVTISYGKNLTDIEQDENIANLCTGIIGYWANSDGELVQTPVVNGPGTYNFANVKAIDFSLDFESKPTVEQLQKRAQQYVSDNNVGIPDVSITLSWVQLEQYSGYEGLSLLDRASLGDTVTVRFPPLGIDVKARVVKTVYDILQDRYSSVEIGSVKANIADTIANNQQATNEQIKNTTSYLEDRIQQSTDLITNGGGYIYRKFDAAKNWVEIGSTDNLDLNKAVHVWRWNNGGFGYSGTGYNGPYRTAITQDGHIVADFIDTGTLTANIVRAGILKDMKGLNFWDMETGEFRLAATATVNDQQIATKPETISGVDVEYASGTSQTIPPTSGWSTTAPAWQDGRYIWQRTVTTLADDTKSISEPTCIQGAKGPQGPAGKDGANGINGKDGTNGKDGASAYVHIKYAPVANPTDTQMTETPSEYIGICTNTTPTDPTTANSYQWSKWQGQDGAQGIPGTPGTNGQTTYVHFAYSTTADGTGNFSTTPFDDARYVGVCTDFKQADPTTPSSYQWSLMQGDGVSQIVEQYYLSTSSTTQTGGSWSTAQPKWQKGRYIWTRSMVTWTDGTTTYTDPVLAQAINGANQSASDAQQSVDDLDNSLNSEGVFNRLTDNGKIQGIYMSGGQLYINANYIKSGTLTANIVRAGILQDMKGLNFWDMETGEFRLAATATVNDQQIATKPETISGVDVEYASGTSQTIPPTSGWSTTAPAWQDGRYIWQRTVTTLADDTKSISEPTCIQGAKGPQGPAGKDGANGINGKDGTNGKDGASAYVHIKYAPVANPTDTQMTETPSEYIGICTNTTPTDPTTANSYQWSKWQGQDGAQGIPGTPGTNGQTTYVHFAYSTTADGTGNFSTTPFDDARYVGVCTDFKQADPTTPSSYQWSLMQGDGVSQIVEQYYLSTSSTTQTGGSWSTAQPKWQKGRYIWTRSMVTWTDGTTTYTDPVLAQAINGANQSASDAQQSVDDLDNSLNSEGVFNRLTDNGKIQGIYMSGGQLYINGSYIRAGTIDASRVNVTNINANNIASGKIASVDRRVVFDLDNNFIDVISSDGNYAVRIVNGMFITMKKNGASFVQTGYLGSYSNANASVVAVDWLDCSEGIVVTNGRRTGLYWEDITIDDGRKTKVLCGWNP